jgi:4-oxalomesaconate hydratase
MTPEPPTLLYIGAHDVDFLVRAGGTLRKYALLGSRVVSVSLTFGERQESERLWRERPGITIEEVKETRLAESRVCAELVGCEFRCLDWNDSPIVFDRERLYALSGLIQEIRPHALITHWPDEITNYDHLDTATAVRRAAQYAGTAGSRVETGREPWTVPTLLFSEPSFPFPDINRYRPNIWIDITDEYDTKLEGLRAAWSHGRLDLSYPLCAELRAYQARLLSLNEDIRYAEAFFTDDPWISNRLPVGPRGGVLGAAGITLAGGGLDG